MTNDLPSGTSVGPMTFNAPYALNGNALTLTGDVIGSGAGQGDGLSCNVPLKIGAPLLLGRANGPYLHAIDVNGQTLILEGNTSIAALDGSGTVNIHKDGSHIIFTGDGTFAGTINGRMTVNGLMPNANATTDTDVPFTPPSRIAGTGTLGNVTINADCILGPGVLGPGVLRTKSLTLHDSLFLEELAPGSVSDAVLVTGTVSLSGGLFVSIESGSPNAGQSFTIIDNDGTDPVIGTFSQVSGGSGVPAEGSTFTVGTTTFQISYKGGDGNDVVITATSGVKTWTGAANGNWTNPQNWSPQAIPAAGEPLVFPAGAPSSTMNNDLPAGFNAGRMTFNGPYILNGNGLTLTSDVVTGHGSADGDGLRCNVPLKIGGAVLLGVGNGPYLQAIDVNGQTLTFEANTSIAALNGSGTVNIHKSGSRIVFTNDGTFTGTINGPITVNALMPNANATTDTDVPFVPFSMIGGTGTMGNITINAGGALSPGGVDIGLLRTKSLTFHNGLFLLMLTSGAASDALQVTGSVSLAGTLDATLSSGSAAIGETFKIIDNDGNDPVSGTFSSVAGSSVIPVEGATFPVGNAMLRISYAGGDGNDVVLTAIAPTTTALSQTSATTIFGDPFTVTASVASTSGTPAGSVTFRDGSTIVATAPLQSGSATWTASDREVGAHNITATFSGTGLFADSASAAAVHNVQVRATTTTLASSTTAAHYRDNVTFTASISPTISIATPLIGTVSFEADGTSFGSATVTNGTASVLTAVLPAGTHSIVARYSGDTHFASSVSTGVTLTIAKAPSELRVSSLSNPALPGNVRLRVSVNAAGSASIPASGKVTVTEDGVVVGEEPLNAGEAIVAIPGLSSGDHNLIASFAGDANLEPASASLTQTVLDAQLSISNIAIAEGNSGSRLVSLFVQLNGSSSKPISVAYTTTDGSARAGVDYEFTSGTVIFAAGEVGKQIDVRIFGDTLAEPDQTLLVVLSNAANASIGNGVGSITILNDDGPITTPPRQRPSRH